LTEAPGQGTGIFRCGFKRRISVASSAGGDQLTDSRDDLLGEHAGLAFPVT
jgi:hypothetical protein